ncbi:MAG: TolC family outer membrane protein [Gammaproteobacteria bacterium]|nr:TolC family outer membrane protein [Gammaproteobacteria bacterium]
MWRKAVLVVASCFVVFTPAWSAGAPGLPEIYALALQKAPEMRAAAAAFAATDAARSQSLRALLPSLSASAESAKNRQDVLETGVGNTGEFRFDSNTYTLTLRQPVFRRDLFTHIDQTTAQITQAQAEYRAVQQAFIVRVAERYFEVLAAQDNLEFARADRTAVARQLEQIRVRHSIGVGALTDLREVEASHDLAITQEIDAESRLTSAEEALRELSDNYPQPLRRLNIEIPLLAPEPATLDAWSRLAEQENQKLLAATGAARVAEQEIARQRAGHYPSLDLVATSSKTESGGRFGDSDIKDNAIALQLNVPLYSGGQISAQVREAQERYTEARERAEQQRRAVIRQTSDAYRAVIASISRVGALTRSIASTEAALDAVETGFQAGTRTAVDVLGAKRTLLRTQRDHAAAHYTYILNTLRLKEAVGTLSQADITALAGWFN